MNKAMKAFDASGNVRSEVETDCQRCGSDDVQTDKFRTRIFCGGCGSSTAVYAHWADAVAAWDDQRQRTEPQCDCPPDRLARKGHRFACPMYAEPGGE